MSAPHMVQYTVRPGQGDENERAIAAVFDQLRATAPDGLRYAAFRLADGVSFVHLVWEETAHDTSVLRELPAFRAFVDGLGERRVEPPVRTPLAMVGAYRSFGE